MVPTEVSPALRPPPGVAPPLDHLPAPQTLVVGRERHESGEVSGLAEVILRHVFKLILICGELKLVKPSLVVTENDNLRMIPFDVSHPTH